VIHKLKLTRPPLHAMCQVQKGGHVRSGRPHLSKDCTFAACEALHVIQLVQYTSTTAPVYANVVCPRGDHSQLSTCYHTLIAPPTPIQGNVSSRRISL
jgi:hypothetical protein